MDLSDVDRAAMVNVTRVTTEWRRRDEQDHLDRVPCRSASSGAYHPTWSASSTSATEDTWTIWTAPGPQDSHGPPTLAEVGKAKLVGAQLSRLAPGISSSATGGQGERPSKDAEPTTEQLSCIGHLLAQGAPLMRISRCLVLSDTV